MADSFQELVEETTAIPDALRLYIDWEVMARGVQLSGEPSPSRPRMTRCTCSGRSSASERFDYRGLKAGRVLKSNL